MKQFLLLFLLAFASQAFSAVKVVATLPDLADLASHIGGDRVTVDYIAHGDQNPHYVEVKPSYMMKLRNADILLEVGMALEIWAQQLVDGSRNNALQVVDLSQAIQKLNVPTKVDASMGDVHPYGNPHYWLDPRNIRPMADEIIAALARVDPSSEQTYRANAEAYLKTLDGKIAQWEQLMKPYAGQKIITFHESWPYFARWLGIDVAGEVEPKPGIVPSPSHTADIIRIVREQGIKVIVVEPFYDMSAPDQIAAATGAKVIRLVTSVGGVPEAKDYISMMDYNISTLKQAFDAK